MSPSPNNEFAINASRLPKRKCAKTLVLMYGFYGATDNAIRKYSNIYHGYGFDVLPIRSYLKHFAWPKCSKSLADRTLAFIHENCSDYDYYLAHAFSMGAFNFTGCLETIDNNPPVHASIRIKIVGVIYDSLAIGSLGGMIDGVAAGISRKKVVRWMVTKTMKAYFYATRRCTVSVHDHILDIAQASPLQVPTLLLYSKNDLLSKYEVIESLIKDWQERFSFPIQERRWDESKHSAHLLMHEVEYLQTLKTYIESVPYLYNDSETQITKL